MPKYYCDYCDSILTHDSQAGRKQHNHGRKHQENVRQYYSQWIAQKMGITTGVPGAGMPMPLVNIIF